MPPFRHFMSIGIGTELIYSFVIVICCLMIYYGTKEIYELSSYKGIKYFRQTFLFFAIAYFFRFFDKFLFMSLEIRRGFEFSPRIFSILTLFIFMYFSSMAIFSLVYSVMWKKWDKKLKGSYLFHALAFVIAMLSIFSRRGMMYLGLNILLFIFVVFVVCYAYKNFRNRKRKHNLYIIYILLSAFWILNILDILIPNFLQTFQLIIYLVSLGIFSSILYRVLKKTGSG